jgi:hypothetical protein
MNHVTTRRLLSLGLAALLLAGAGAAWGQKLTEMYIPIGQSPGLSGKHTVIGNIEAVDARMRTITCAYGAESTTMKVTDTTRIWLDRSKAKLPSVKGTLGDCQVGRRMEAKFVNNQRVAGGAVEWIKVEVGPAGGG